MTADHYGPDWPWSRRVLVGLLVLATLAGVGAVIHRAYLRSEPRPSYLNLLAENNGSAMAKLNAAVRHDHDSALAAGYRARAWAERNPQYSRDQNLRATYVKLTRPPDLGAGSPDNEVAGYIAEVAWDHLCHLHLQHPTD